MRFAPLRSGDNTIAFRVGDHRCTLRRNPCTSNCMPFFRARSAFAATLLAALTVLGNESADRASTKSLAGQLLIAAPAIGDPRFAHSVILVIRHDETGAFGIVINRPVGERSINSLLEAPGDSQPD